MAISWVRILLLTAIAATGVTAADNMYLLVRQYTPTFCEGRSCTKGQEPELMTIHGMWPSGMTYDDRSPQYCSNEKLDTSSLTDTTLARLNCAWISSTGSNEGFWSHEWEKHGTCAGFTSQEDYFKATLDANDRYDLNVAFANAGISFSGANTSPTVSQLEDAMRDEFGIRGQVVKCEGDDLFEVYMCLDWDTLEAFECDSSFWNTCGGGSSNVVFPEGSGDSAASCELAPSSLSGSSSGKESTATATSAALVATGVFGLAFLPLL